MSQEKPIQSYKTEEIEQVFKEKYKMLLAFFSIRIKRNIRKKGWNMNEDSSEEWAEAFIKLTYVDFKAKLQEEKYKEYPLEKLPMKMAENVWELVNDSRREKREREKKQDNQIIGIDGHEEELMSDTSLQNEIEREDWLEKFMNWLKKLPDGLKAEEVKLCILLIERRSYKKISQELECSEEAVKMRVLRLRKNLIKIKMIKELKKKMKRS